MSNGNGKKVDVLGTTIFTAAMLVGAYGVYNGSRSIDAIVILMAGAVGIASYVLSLIRYIYNDISNINTRQSAWEEDRRAQDVIARDRHQEALNEIIEQEQERDRQAVDRTLAEVEVRAQTEERDRVQARDEKIDNGDNHD